MTSIASSPQLDTSPAGGTQTEQTWGQYKAASVLGPSASEVLRPALTDRLEGTRARRAVRSPFRRVPCAFDRARCLGEVCSNALGKVQACCVAGTERCLLRLPLARRWKLVVRRQPFQGKPFSSSMRSGPLGPGVSGQNLTALTK